MFSSVPPRTEYLEAYLEFDAVELIGAVGMVAVIGLVVRVEDVATSAP